MHPPLESNSLISTITLSVKIETQMKMIAYLINMLALKVTFFQVFNYDISHWPETSLFRGAVKKTEEKWYFVL